MVIDKNVAEAVKNFLENYAEVQVLVEILTELPNHLYFYQQKPAINQSIAQVLKEAAKIY